ncbi:MarR family winged helix-turn-helix transcriptional regulator [Novosphingobium sp.]|uniref:MarR family winged helix-turn-helix transcriptional regulator n=1 Tax=Novosphingobium sp. TaxID=1874826 RepID=UPI0035AED552
MQSPYLIVSLLQGFYWFDSGLQSFLRSRGWPTLTHSQSMVMMNITTGATRPVEIARNLGISRQAVHVTLSQIAEIGMIRFTDDPSDKRSKIVVLTEMGEPMRRDAQTAVTIMTKHLAKRIGQPQLAGLIAACGVDWGDPIDFEAEALALGEE